MSYISIKVLLVRESKHERNKKQFTMAYLLNCYYICKYFSAKMVTTSEKEKQKAERNPVSDSVFLFRFIDTRNLLKCLSRYSNLTLRAVKLSRC